MHSSNGSIVSTAIHHDKCKWWIWTKFVRQNGAKKRVTRLFESQPVTAAKTIVIIHFDVKC